MAGARPDVLWHEDRLVQDDGGERGRAQRHDRLPAFDGTHPHGIGLILLVALVVAVLVSRRSSEP